VSIVNRHAECAIYDSQKEGARIRKYVEYIAADGVENSLLPCMEGISIKTLADERHGLVRALTVLSL
jgi:hypothetical protein